MQLDRSFWLNRRVCVTGGSGFLGFHLIQQLRALGARVRSFSLPLRPEHPLARLDDVEQVFGDIRDAAAVRAALAGSNVVLHTAGLVAVSGPALAHMHSVHGTGTHNVLAAADRAARIVHTSSVVAVGACRTLDALDEDSPFNLDDLAVDYVHAKRAAELLALQAAATGQHVVIVNPSYLVGPEDHERSEIGRLCARFWKGQLWLVPPGGFNFADVRDVARGHLLAAEKGQPGRRYILAGENHTLSSFFDLLARVAGLRPRGLVPLPAALFTLIAAIMEARARLRCRPAFPSLQQVRLHGRHWFYRRDRAGRELGYRPRPLVETLLDAYRWHQAGGLPAVRGLPRWWLRPAA